MSGFMLGFSTDTALVVLVGDLWWSWDYRSASSVLIGGFQCHQSWYLSELPSLRTLGIGPPFYDGSLPFSETVMVNVSGWKEQAFPLLVPQSYLPFLLLFNICMNLLTEVIH